MIPIKYRRASPAQVNYDWIDFSSGTGYVYFYAGETRNLTTGSSYMILSNNVFYTARLYFGYGGSSNAYELLGDIDCDVLVNKPLTIAGNAIVEVPWAVSGPATSSAYIIIKLRKYNTTTGESEIVEVKTDVISDTASSYKYCTTTLSCVVPLTHFKIGEYLRMTIEVWGKNSASAAYNVRIAFDPAARSADYQITPSTWSASYSSRLRLQLPVRIAQ